MTIGYGLVIVIYFGVICRCGVIIVGYSGLVVMVVSVASATLVVVVVVEVYRNSCSISTK
jgi:hypothetical protein